MFRSMPQNPLKYPLRHDPLDPFEQRFGDVFPLKPLGALPPVVSLQADTPPIFNQGSYGSCSAASGVNVVETLWKQKTHQSVALSQFFLYEVERRIEGTLTQDSGARLRNTQQALMTVGTCEEALDPYVPQDFLVTLTPAMIANASQYRIARGYWAPTLLEILNALALGWPVQVGIVVYSSFESPSVARTGQVPLPGPAEAVLGGHAMMLDGYNIPERWVDDVNSWGAQWGLGGRCHLPFGYFDNPHTFMSARVYQLD